MRADRVDPRLGRELRRAAREHDAPIWARVARLLGAPASARRTVNVGRLARLTSEGDTVVVPGKVLGTGSLPHGITLCAFDVSAPAAEKVRAAGGSVAGLESAVRASPTGRGVKLLG